MFAHLIVILTIRVFYIIRKSIILKTETIIIKKEYIYLKNVLKSAMRLLTVILPFMFLIATSHEVVSQSTVFSENRVVECSIEEATTLMMRQTQPVRKITRRSTTASDHTPKFLTYLSSNACERHNSGATQDAYLRYLKLRL